MHGGCRYTYLVLEEMLYEKDCLCCMKQSVPQANTLNECSIDVRTFVFLQPPKLPPS